MSQVQCFFLRRAEIAENITVVQEEIVMNKCQIYWFRVNKRHLIADCCGAAVFTALGGGRLIAVVFYLIAVEICSMNYLCVLHFSSSDKDTLNLVKSQFAERRIFYDTYIKMMLLQSAAFAAVFAFGTFIGSVSGIDLPFLPRVIFKSGTIISSVGYYTLLIALVMIALVVMAGFTEKCTTVGRTVLIIGTVYIALIYQLVYLAFLMLAKLSPKVELVYNAFAFAGSAMLCVMMAVFVTAVKRNRTKFMTK